MIGRSAIAIAGIAALALASLVAPAAAQKQRILAELAFGRLAGIEPGTYLAGDNVKFAIAPENENFVLRFDNNPETFVLYTTHASLGGRILKYDSGEEALQVAGWGGITLYTDAQPTGLPAERVGDGIPPPLPSVSMSDMQTAANDETQHLAYMRGLRVGFTTDWNAMANPVMRMFAFDAMENVVRGIDRFTYVYAGREALTRRLNQVLIAPGDHPTLKLSGHTLIVTFSAQRGYEGRASSRAIDRALRAVFLRH